MNAIFLGHSTLLDSGVLQLQNGNRIFQGMLPKQRGALPNLELGSLLRLTGVCRLVKNATAEPSKSDPDFELLLCAPSHVVLLEAPPWWNWRRLLWVGGIFIGVVTVAGAWIVMTLRKNRLLKQAHQELRKAADELEIRVEHRTADLAKSNAGLSHEQALLRTLLDNASDFIYFKDANSRFVRCSLSLCARSGLAHEQMVGKTDFDLSLEEFARSAFEDEQEIIRTGKPLVGKLEREVHPDGRITWVLTTKMPWRDPEGKIIGTFGISRDVTSIKEAEAKLEQVHQQLVDASRKAGQAEVASSVLHNVGNVLNSVNVSVGVIADRFRHGKSENLAKAIGLLREHEADLSDFISHDSRGAKLIPYLEGVAELYVQEEKRMIQEVLGLGENVNHIIKIVAMQQDYATASAVIEPVNLAEVAEGALKMQSAAYSHHSIRVVREFDPLPTIVADKHKIIQILVNLLQNSMSACSEQQSAEKVVSVRLQKSGDDRIRVEVCDNGAGIAGVSPGKQLKQLTGLESRRKIVDTWHARYAWNMPGRSIT
jgi:PAS domain S-box-containing protein